MYLAEDAEHDERHDGIRVYAHTRTPRYTCIRVYLAEDAEHDERHDGIRVYAYAKVYMHALMVHAPRAYMHLAEDAEHDERHDAREKHEDDNGVDDREPVDLSLIHI